MKTVAMLILCLLAMAGCSVSGQMGTVQNDGQPFYSRFSHLADALKGHPSLIVRGSGSQASVVLRKSGSVSNQTPLYVIDGMALGRDYNQANRAVNMHQVKSIRILRSTAEVIAYGHLGANGVIEIETFHGPTEGWSGSR